MSTAPLSTAHAQLRLRAGRPVSFRWIDPADPGSPEGGEGGEGGESWQPARETSAPRELARLAREGAGLSAGTVLSTSTGLSTRTVSWWEEDLEDYLEDPARWPGLLAHPLELAHGAFLEARAGRQSGGLGRVAFADPSELPVPGDRPVPGTRISPLAGIARAETLLRLGFDDRLGSLGLALWDFGLRATPLGLLARSEPALAGAAELPTLPPGHELGTAARHQLILRHRGPRWLAFDLLATGLAGHWPPVLSAARALWRHRRRGPASVSPEAIRPLHPDLDAEPGAGTAHRLVAILPTLGRPEHLVRVLEDLAAQTVRPVGAVVVEQGVIEPGGTEPGAVEQRAAEGPTTAGDGRSPGLLDRPDLLAPGALEALDLPFPVLHRRVPWAGAGRARNLAFRLADELLAEGTAAWTGYLLLDDDIRLSPRWVETLLAVARAYRTGAVLSAVHLPHQSAEEARGDGLPRPVATFGSGASLVSAEAVRAAGPFDETLDGGYGEDWDYGMRLHRAGFPLVLAPQEPVLHLKAPSGGLRSERRYPWTGLRPLPAPSPMVMRTRRRHLTAEQFQGWRLFYALSRLGAVRPWSWPGELVRLIRGWRQSRRWALHLEERGADPETVAGEVP